MPPARVALRARVRVVLASLSETPSGRAACAARPAARCRYHRRMSDASSFLSSVARVVVRVVVAVVGAVLALVGLAVMLGAALLGVAVALVLVVWARLRGRPAPPVRFRWRQSWERRGRFSTGFGRRGPSGPAPSRRDDGVVDVDFTEAPAPPPSPPKRLE